MLQIKRWLAPPVFPDDRIKTRRASLLNYALINVATLIPVLLVGNLLGGRTPLPVFGANVSGLTGCLILRAWMQRGAVRPASMALMVASLVLIAASVAGLGTIRAPATALCVLVVITGGLLFDLRGIVIATALQVMHQSLTGADRDITERKRAEDALRESGEKYRAIADFTYDWEYWLGPDGRYIYVSPSCERITGYRAEEFLQDPALLERIVHPDDRALVTDHLKQGVLHDSDHRIDFRIVTRGGEERWIGHCCQSVYGRQGQYLGQRGSHRDITERKRAEQALRESEELHRITMEHILDPVFITDDAGRFTFICANVPHILGYSTEELQAMGSISILTGEDLFNLEELETRREIRDIERVIVDKQGRSQDYVITVRRVSIKGGTVLYTFHDITERKRAEDALAVREKEYRTLVEHIPYFVVRYDTDLRRVYVNPAWEKVSGLSAREVINVPAADIPRVPQPATAEYVEKLREVLETKSPRAIEFTWVNAYGVTLFLEYVIVPEYDQCGQVVGLLCVGHDLTEHKRAKEAQQKYAERLQRLARQIVSAQEAERKRIAVELHDELGQALTAIGFDLAAVAQALPPRPGPAVEQKLARARSLVSELDERVSELALDLRPSMLDDLGLLPALRWYAGRYVERTGVEVELEASGLEERLPQEIETTLYRIVQEALTNVAKHAQASRASVHLERQASSVVVLIEDDGRGFSVQGGKDTHPPVHGLGLLGMQERAALLGGTLSVESHPGQGTRLAIQIPLPQGERS